MTNVRGGGGPNSATSSSNTNSQGVLMVGPNFKVEADLQGGKSNFNETVSLLPLLKNRVKNYKIVNKWGQK